MTILIGFRRDRVQPALDAVDDGGRFAAPLVDRHPGEWSEGHPLEAGGTPGLDDVDLAAVALDAHAEAGEVAVPVDGVPAGHRQGGDAAGGEAEGASFRHRVPQRRAPDPVPCGLGCVIKPQTSGINPWG